MLVGKGNLQNSNNTAQNQKVTQAVNAPEIGQNNTANLKQNQDIQQPQKSDKTTP